MPGQAGQPVAVGERLGVGRAIHVAERRAVRLRERDPIGIGERGPIRQPELIA